MNAEEALLTAINSRKQPDRERNRPGCQLCKRGRLRSSLPANKTHRARRRDKLRLVDVVARFFLHHDDFDKLDDFCARSAVADHVAQ